MSKTLDSIEAAIEDIKAGRAVIVVDDEDRENEGDFIAAAQLVTPEMVNFMATHGRGLICTPLTESRCDELDLHLMVGKNTDPMGTAFTVSVDLQGHGNTTGISAADRSRTIHSLVDPNTKPEDLGRPGHIFPLKAKNGGVLRRTGHTEAAIDLARLAGLEPAGVIVEIMNADGTMARLPELLEIAKRFDLKIISIEDLVAYRLASESLIVREYEKSFDFEGCPFKLISYRQTTTNDRHMALVRGNWDEDEEVAVRVHASLISGDLFAASRCMTGTSLYAAMKQIAKTGKGVLVYMHQRERDEAARDALGTHELDSLETKWNRGPQIDPRDYGVGAQILRDVGVRKMRLLSNAQTKRTGIIGYGLEVVSTEALLSPQELDNKN